MQELIKQLAANRNVYRAMLEGVPQEVFTWHEREGKWNLLEVVCHLFDEEREDFRMRLHSVLTDPGKSFPPIDPVGWVGERNYATRSYGDMVIRFIDARDDSITWLNGLTDPRWDNTHHHPKIGPMSARFILANWVAHDYLHFRQITRINHGYLRFSSGVDLSYAGEW